ncbi:MAG: hypothetical protein HFJ80_00190 [Clostridiales bacterium]|nr:hypothetical protein [Clostridiales bacterium]
MRSGYHGRAPYRDEELEVAEELVPDPFSEEPHTRPHIRRRLAGTSRGVGMARAGSYGPGQETPAHERTSGGENS